MEAIQPLEAYVERVRASRAYSAELNAQKVRALKDVSKRVLGGVYDAVKAIGKTTARIIPETLELINKYADTCDAARAYEDLTGDDSSQLRRQKMQEVRAKKREVNTINRRFKRDYRALRKKLFQDYMDKAHEESLRSNSEEVPEEDSAYFVRIDNLLRGLRPERAGEEAVIKNETTDKYQREVDALQDLESQLNQAREEYEQARDHFNYSHETTRHIAGGVSGTAAGLAGLVGGAILAGPLGALVGGAAAAYAGARKAANSEGLVDTLEGVGTNIKNSRQMYSLQEQAAKLSEKVGKQISVQDFVQMQQQQEREKAVEEQMKEAKSGIDESLRGYQRALNIISGEGNNDEGNNEEARRLAERSIMIGNEAIKAHNEICYQNGELSKILGSFQELFQKYARFAA